jgi:hypothetical protein
MVASGLYKPVSDMVVMQVFSSDNLIDKVG